jgi:hypothetical protein
MKNIIRFDYHSLRNETHVEYHETCGGLIVKYNPDTLGIRPQYNYYKPLFDSEVSVLDIIRKSEYTGDIDEQDYRRDHLFRGFSDAVKSALNHFDPAKKEAALKLNALLEHYGNIAAKALDQETAAIDDLLRELNTGNYPACLQILSLTDWVTQLGIENEAFKLLMAARYGETAQRPATRMRATRIEVDKSFRAILNQLDAIVLVNGITDYEAFINELNAVSERYRNILAQEKGARKARNDKKEEKK